MHNSQLRFTGCLCKRVDIILLKVHTLVFLRAVYGHVSGSQTQVKMSYYLDRAYLVTWEHLRIELRPLGCRQATTSSSEMVTLLG